jgi:phage FluMu protein Com
MMNEEVYVVIPLMTGAAGEASVTITNATFQITSSSIKRYPEKDFGIWLVEQISEIRKYLAKTSGFYGIIKKKYYCPSCSTKLDPNLRAPMETTFNLKYRDFTPFTLKITFPSIECPKCKKVSGIDIKDPPGSMVYKAILNAFSTENIKP